jgi:hypothetical protein
MIDDETMAEIEAIQRRRREAISPGTYRDRFTAELVKAMQNTGDATMDLLLWITAEYYYISDEAGMPALWVYHRGHRQRVWLNDWVVQVERGFIPLHATEFERRYGAVQA